MTTMINLADLAPPEVIETLDYETVLHRIVGRFKTLWAALRSIDPTLPDYDVEMLETDPAVIVFEAQSYIELLLRADGNDKAKQLLLAYATGANLDHLLASYHRVTRLPGESDEAFRSRGQLAPEATADFAMTPGGYIYKVRTEFGDAIKDVRTIRKGDGRIELRLLGKGPDGTVTDEVLAAVIRAFEPEGASQSTDILSVLPAIVDTRHVSITLKVPRGPDQATVLAAAGVQLGLYAASRMFLSAGLYLDALYAAAHVPPVITVEIGGLSENIPPRREAAIRLIFDSITCEILA